MAEAETVVVVCFSCGCRPGVKGWRGYFKRDGAQWLHVNCPRPKER